MPENKEIGRIGGGMFILILIILFFAAHGGQNEMIYMAFIFVFIVIALFSYGFWSAVSKGEGIWQYMGKHNLQHQQISNPNYHFGQPSSSGSFRNYKSNPNKNVHICAPPKMGGARLNIYTIPLNQSPLSRSPSTRSTRSPAHKTQPSAGAEALGRTPSTSHHHRHYSGSLSGNHHNSSQRHKSSFRQQSTPRVSHKHDTNNSGSVNEDQVKVEVYTNQSVLVDNNQPSDCNDRVTTSVSKTNNNELMSTGVVLVVPTISPTPETTTPKDTQIPIPSDN